MGRVFIGDYLVNPDDIYSVAEKIVFPPNGETWMTAVVVKIRKEPYSLTIYNDKSLPIIAMECYTALAKFVRSGSQNTDEIIDEYSFINDVGMECDIEGHLNISGYYNHNFVEDPEIRSKSDFVKKYLS